jgi:glycerol kinase
VILAIDQGTTGTTCLVVDGELRVRGRGYREFTQYFPQPGWVEHDPEQLWSSVLGAAEAAVRAAGVPLSALEAIGITNQRETTILWERATGQPVAPAIVWQDRRTAERCRALPAELLRARTGLVPDPYFSATKLEWLLSRTDLPSSELAFGTVDTWLVWKLTDGQLHITDASNASRTMLFDIHALRWDDELCAALGVLPAALPEPVASARVIADTDPAAFIGVRAPLAGMAGDQQAALFGQAALDPGLGKNTYGTGSFVLQNAGPNPPPVRPGLLTTVAWGIEDRPVYALEASVFVTGAAVQWLRDGLGILSEPGETEAMARSLDSNDGVYFVPALTGLGSPHWDPYARGTIVGITRGTQREHLARAALEAIAYQTVDAVEAMEAASGKRLAELRADGGAVANAWLMQFQADVLGRPVVVPEVSETTAMGAAFLAGIGSGMWTSTDVRSIWREAARYEPRMGDEERQSLLHEWRRAVERAKGWAH